MRFWPFKREIEIRQEQGQGAYTSGLIAQILAQASSGSPDPSATAALEFSAGTWARAFSSAQITPAFPQITPAMLGSIGRQLLRAGEAVYAIDVRRGQISLSSSRGMGRSRRSRSGELGLPRGRIRAFKLQDPATVRRVSPAFSICR